jgi:hypothetical protein
MGAHVDQKIKSFFAPQYLPSELSNSVEYGNLFHQGLSQFENRTSRDNQKKPWSVCQHLSTYEGLIDYYITSGSIMVLFGKCFCYDCYEMILSRGDLNEFMKSCEHMTDGGFQRAFVDSLYSINREAFRTKKSNCSMESTRWTWISCSHIANQGELEKLYSSCSPIFLSEGFVTCNDCLNVVPTSSIFMQAFLDCEPMTDEQLQHRVIDQLYPINREVLDAIGHNKPI